MPAAGLAVEMSGDESRLLRSVQATINKFGKLEGQMQGAVNKAKSVEKSVRRIGSGGKKELGPQGGLASSIKGTIARIGGITAVAVLAKAALSDMAATRTAAGERITTAVEGRGRLVQLSDEPRAFKESVEQVRRARTEHGLTKQDAQALVFAAASAGRQENVQFFAGLTEIAFAPVAAVTATQKISQTFRDAGEDRAIINKTIKAAAASPVGASDIARVAAIPAVAFENIGGTDVELLALLGVLSKPFKSPVAAAEKITTLVNQVGAKRGFIDPTILRQTEQKLGVPQLEGLELLRQLPALAKAGALRTTAASEPVSLSLREFLREVRQEEISETDARLFSQLGVLPKVLKDKTKAGKLEKLSDQVGKRRELIDPTILRQTEQKLGVSRLEGLELLRQLPALAKAGALRTPAKPAESVSLRDFLGEKQAFVGLNAILSADAQIRAQVQAVQQAGAQTGTANDQLARQVRIARADPELRAVRLAAIAKQRQQVAEEDDLAVSDKLADALVAERLTRVRERGSEFGVTVQKAALFLARKFSPTDRGFIERSLFFGKPTKSESSLDLGISPELQESIFNLLGPVEVERLLRESNRPVPAEILNQLPRQFGIVKQLAELQEESKAGLKFRRTRGDFARLEEALVEGRLEDVLPALDLLRKRSALKDRNPNSFSPAVSPLFDPQLVEDLDELRPQVEKLVLDAFPIPLRLPDSIFGPPAPAKGDLPLGVPLRAGPPQPRGEVPTLPPVASARETSEVNREAEEVVSGQSPVARTPRGSPQATAIETTPAFRETAEVVAAPLERGALGPPELLGLPGRPAPKPEEGILQGRRPTELFKQEAVPKGRGSADETSRAEAPSAISRGAGDAGRRANR